LFAIFSKELFLREKSSGRYVITLPFQLFTLSREYNFFSKGSSENHAVEYQIASQAITVVENKKSEEQYTLPFQIDANVPKRLLLIGTSNSVTNTKQDLSMGRIQPVAILQYEAGTNYGR